MPRINVEDARAIPVAVPPLGEQAEIVHRVEALFTLADTIEAQVKAATAGAEKLPQAILSKAFQGELVLTEAELARAESRSYETAGELLARIKATTIDLAERKPGSDAGRRRRSRSRPR